MGDPGRLGLLLRHPGEAAIARGRNKGVDGRRRLVARRLLGAEAHVIHVGDEVRLRGGPSRGRTKGEASQAGDDVTGGLGGGRQVYVAADMEKNRSNISIQRSGQQGGRKRDKVA